MNNKSAYKRLMDKTKENFAENNTQYKADIVEDIVNIQNMSLQECIDNTKKHMVELNKQFESGNILEFDLAIKARVLKRALTVLITKLETDDKVPEK